VTHAHDHRRSRADPLAGLLVAGLMLWASAGLPRESARIFERSPVEIDPVEVGRAIVGVPVEIGERFRRDSPLGG
jgi:Co/Zn/Cd efflux system component